jgi:hypothetical protein
VNLATFERAQVAAFAYCEARHTGSVDCMKAVCYVLRNRVKAGWGDGSWLSVIDSAVMVSGHSLTLEEVPIASASDRLLQLIVRDVDDIYLGQDRSDDPTRIVVCGDDPPKNSALYYAFVDRDIRNWFVLNIIKQPADHAHIGNIGPLMLYR